ncbi:MAG: LicD family protein [Synergistaceae bacterium]|nr:LicD family protein [Synergistaceae bacterium]
MQEMTIDEIHDAELYVLKRIDSICKELDIKYWVMFGTLLGAVRERGFIKWDDDLDIVMKRNDYEKFIKYFMQGGGGLHLDHILTRKNYPYYIARVSETTNSITESYQSGLFVDVYPMDGLEGPQWLTGNRRKIADLIIFHLIGGNKYILGKTLLRRIRYAAFVYTCRFVRKVFGLNFSRRLALKILDSIAKKYKFDTSEYVGIPGWETSECWKREYFDETIYLKFEDFSVPVPKGYHEILTQKYGDYMQLPPENERVPHHYYKAYKP